MGRLRSYRDRSGLRFAAWVYAARMSVAVAVTGGALSGVAFTARPAVAASSDRVTMTSFHGFKHPAGIVAGPDGALWFASTSNATIGRVTTDGAFSGYSR
jgi:virginiamycin B lyase